MSGLVAVSAGLLLVGGLLGVSAGLSRVWSPRPQPTGRSVGETWSRLSRRPPGVRGRRRDLILLASTLSGFALAALTGWALFILLAPAIALGLPYLLVVPKQRDVELMETLDRWLRSLSATLATGKSITDAIRISLRTAPGGLRDELALLVARLNNRWDTTEALQRLADGLDSPDADAVVAALILATRRGSVGASQTLHALADSLQDQLKARRLIEIERAKPYVVVRQVTVITSLTLLIVFTVNPGFFAPYHTPAGQLILAGLLGLYAGSLLLMRRKARQAVRERILVEVRP